MWFIKKRPNADAFDKNLPWLFCVVVILFGLIQVLEDQRNDTPPKFKAQSSKRYQDFVKKTQRLIDADSAEASSQNTQGNNDSMDIDDAHSVELIPEIDPITKAPLEHPVRNKHCNHIYGYRSVQQSIQLNPRLR